MSAVHIVPGLNDPTCGIAVAAKQLIRRGIGAEGEVWVHSMWLPMVVWASFKALFMRKKLVRMPHGCNDPVKVRHHWHKKRFVAPIERWIFRHAEKIVATCPEEEKWIRDFEPRVKKVEIVPLGGDATLAPLKPLDASLPLRLLFVGRLHPLKGVEYLLEAMPRDAQLVLVGKDDGEEDKLRKIAAERNLNVEFRGIVSEEEKIAAYDWCDILVLPTLSENFGLVVAEALERGKRVITTDGAPAWGGGETYGGRLTYLEGFRDGTPEKRVSLLRTAFEKMR